MQVLEILIKIPNIYFKSPPEICYTKEKIEFVSIVRIVIELQLVESLKMQLTNVVKCTFNNAAI